jgi:hypothetical protein
MLTRLRTPLPGLLGLVLALATLLPPAGWALCVAPGGHVEVEPVALEAGGGCCADDGETAPPAAGVTGAGGDCESCWDLVAFSGGAERCRTHTLGAPGLAATLAAQPCTAPPAPAHLRSANPARASSPPAPHLATTRLRD